MDLKVVVASSDDDDNAANFRSSGYAAENNGYERKVVINTVIAQSVLTT